MTAPLDVPWLTVNRFDPRAVRLYERHYSCRQYKDGRKRTQFVPPGSPLLLLLPDESALFGWLKNTVERLDKQVGINCFVFRNESEWRASELVTSAMALAWEKWPGERLFTYVDANKIRPTRTPGRCFIKAGWRQCGTSKKGLVILEAMP